MGGRIPHNINSYGSVVFVELRRWLAQSRTSEPKASRHVSVDPAACVGLATGFLGPRQ